MPRDPRSSRVAQLTASYCGLQGGCGTLLPLFFNALQQAREAAQSPLVAPRGVMRDLRASAYIDPNDPTLLYVPEGGGDVDLPDAYPHTMHRRR